MGVMIFGGLGGAGYGYVTNQEEAWKAEESERKETGGYVIKDLGPGLKQIELLPSGKFWREDALFSPGKDIRTQTLGSALTELTKDCEIGNVAPTTEQAGFGSATSGLIVEVKSCK